MYLRFALLAALVAVSFSIAPSARAQETGSIETALSGVDLRLGGTIQARLGYGNDRQAEQQRIDFGLRRARLRTLARVADRYGAYFQIETAGGAVTLLDAYAAADLGDGWSVRLGRYPGAQIRANEMTSHTRIDGLERAAIAGEWQNLTMGNGGRDFGLELLRETDRTHLQIWLHDGDGSWSRTGGQYRDNVVGGGVTRGAEDVAFALSAYGAWEPEAMEGVEVGGFASYNAQGGAATQLGDDGRSYATAAAHAYWGARPGSQPFRVKLDAVAIAFEDAPLGHERSGGVALLGAARLRPWAELYARAERFERRLEGEAFAEATYLMAGVSYSPSARAGGAYRNQRLTLGYQMRRSDGTATDHLLALQAQFVF